MNEKSYTDKRDNDYRYGEFFPSEFSPFAYNETVNQDFSPLPKAEAMKRGFKWREPELKEYQTTIDSKDLPDNIKDATDNILNEIIKCASCGRAYRVIAMELSFLRQTGIPLPRLCHNCRYADRFKEINPPQFYKGKCQCAGMTSENGVFKNFANHFHGTDLCPNEFKTAYAPNQNTIIYCETCYQQELI